MPNRNTIHIIFNAHIDPIWLWPLRSGLDEVLATCRSACDRLDRHRDLIFTRGEAWVYQQIERIDPALFARIAKHIETGQWEIVGGWYIQPDCNLPSGFAMKKQIEIGQRYFREKFGKLPEVAYNVDSFGHAATLPTLMAEAGQKYYVMMRPQSHELKLPANLFRWREREGSPEILTFRIPSGYCTPDPLKKDFLWWSLSDRPAGVNHTMYFAGIGDHGGGPTEQQIAWLRQNWNDIGDCDLLFSTPRKFFEAIEPDRDKLPLVTGELQHHAIGCYSVYRPIKTAVRRAEHLLAQAENFASSGPTDARARQQLDAAWEKVCFHHFHDTLGGSCLPSAYPRVLDDLGGASAAAQETMDIAFRQQTSKLPPDPLQRLVFHNPSELPFRGCVQVDPWLERDHWPKTAQLFDEEGRSLPYQLVDPEAVMEKKYINGVLLHIDLPPQGRRVIRIHPSAGEPRFDNKLTATADHLSSAAAEVWPGESRLTVVGVELAGIDLHAISDETDTWSHGIDRYGETPAAVPYWAENQVIESGPLRAAAMRRGTIGTSTIRAEWRVFADEPIVELLLRLQWNDPKQVLKLVVPLPDVITASCGGPDAQPDTGKTPLSQEMFRTDGILGGRLARALDGRERPIRDWTLINLPDGKQIGVVCPDVFALDATPARLRFTLLRTPLMAYHEPKVTPYPRAIHADQGVHDFRFRFVGGDVTPAMLDEQAAMMHCPPLMASVTIGMPSHMTSPKY